MHLIANTITHNIIFPLQHKCYTLNHFAAGLPKCTRTEVYQAITKKFDPKY